MQPKNYSIQEVFNNAQMGLTFEFYCSKTPTFIVEDLSKYSTKNVVLTGNKKTQPTWSSAILVQEFNGKRPRYQFKIAPQDFMTISQPLNSILNWITEEAILDYSTKLKVSLLFKNQHLKTLSNISNMNLGKMVLKMDENTLYSRFPEMTKSPFSLSIKSITPYGGFSNSSLTLYNLETSFKIPISENHGVDFTEQMYGMLKFNYIGGSDYSKKISLINETLNYYVLSTFQVLNSNLYEPQMEYELNKLIENYNKLRRAYYEPDYFLSEYKDIKVSVDLNKNVQTIKTYWDKLRNPLLNLMLESNLRKGYFNYNLDENKFEIKAAKIYGSKIDNLFLVDCEVEGLLENCSLWKCKIKFSNLKNSILVSNNQIESSLLESCRADSTNKIEKSYVINTGEIINCAVNESIIINAGIGNTAKLDEECTVIQLTEKKAPDLKLGAMSDEIRDYKWIKAMKKSEDSDFGNLFIHKY